MNWKTRQLFSDQEHGIVSGLSPINMTSGGNVPYPSYQDGGTVPAQEPSIEQQVADLAAKMGISPVEARAMILQQMIQDKGVTLSEDVINQFATGLITLHDALSQAVGPPKMQTGGLALDLFEEGDQEINEPLNTMAQTVSPSIADITPNETVEETVTVTEDQGPTDISALKEAFQQLAVQAVQAANAAVQQGASVEQVEGPLGERLMMIDEQYRQKSGVQDTILTDEFLAQLDALSDISTEPLAMQEGGEVPAIDELTANRVDLQRAKADLANHDKNKPTNPRKLAWWRNKRKPLEAAVQVAQEKVDLLQLEAKNVTGVSTDTASTTGTGTTGTPTVDELTTRSFWEEMKANANRARRGTLMSGKSKQGGILGTMDVLGQAQLAEAETLGSAQEAMLRELGETERTAAVLGKPTALTKEERDYARGNRLFAQQLFLKRVGADVDIDEVVEEFIREGIPLPAFGGTVIGGLGGTITVKGKEVDFAEHYRQSKAADPTKKFEAIKAEWISLNPK